MKRLFIGFVLLAALLLPFASNAQTCVGDYALNTGTDATKWFTLTDAATSIVSTYADDAAYAVTPMGMTFSFCGVDYTDFSVSSNGHFRLGSTATSYSAYSNPFSSSNAGTNTPKIHGVGRDLGTGSNGYISYEVFGTAPNRTFVCEFAMGYTYGNTRAGDVKWQIQLCENGQWRIVYGDTPSTCPSSFQIGASTSSSDAMTINPSTHTMSLGTTSTTYSVWPGAYRYYEFYVPSCPRVTNLASTSITSTSIAVSWTAGSSESTWRVKLLDAANTVVDSADVTTASHTFSNLTANTPYTVSVAPICSATDMGPAVTASYRTECAEMVLPYTNSFNDEVTGSTSSANFVYCWSRAAVNATSSNYPYVNGTSGVDASKCLYYYSYASTSYADMTIAVLPQVNTTTYPINTLRLKAQYKSSSTSPFALVGVLTDPTDASTFTVVDTVNVTSAWELKTSYLSNYTGMGSYIGIAVSKPASGSRAIYVDNVTLEVAPGCVEPEAPVASNATTSSIDLTWTANGIESQWEIGYAAEGDTAYTVVSGVTATTYTVTGLTDATTYTFAVRAACSATAISGWSNSITASTDCNTYMVSDTHPFVQDFEGDFPGICWSSFRTAGTGSNDWRQTTTCHSGSHGAYIPDQTATTRHNLVTPLLNIPSANAYQVSFWVKRETSYANKYLEGIRVWASTSTDTIDGTELIYIHRNYTLAPVETAGGWYNYTATIPTSGDMYIIFEGINEYGSATYMDDINIEVIPTCFPVTALTTTATTATTATVAWHQAASETNWQIRYKETTDTAWTLVQQILTDSVYTFTGLNHTSSYLYQVRAYCAADDQGAWVEGSFQTECAANDLPYTASFTNFTRCWGIYSGLLDNVMAGTANLAATTYGWSVDNTVLTGQHMSINIYGSSLNRWVFTPEININSDVELSFDAAFTEYGESTAPDTNVADDRFVVLMYVDDSLTILRQYGADTTRDDAPLLGFTTTGTHVVIPVNGLTNSTVRFAFYAESTVYNGDNDLHIGNIQVNSTLPDSVNVMVVSADTAMGTVTGAGRYAVGDTLTIAAVANTGYHFVAWNDLDTNAIRTIVADTVDMVFTATFAANPIDTTYLVMTDYNASYYSSDNDWYIYLADDDYAFYFDIVADSIVNGTVYDLDDMLEDYSYGYCLAGEITYNSCTYTQTLANNTLSIHAVVNATGAIYDIVYTQTFTYDTITLQMASYEIAYDADEEMYIAEMESADSNYIFQFGFDAEPVDGVTYTLGTGFQAMGADYVNYEYILPTSGTFVKNVVGRNLTVNSVLTEGYTTYVLSYSEILPIDSINVTVVSADETMGTVTGAGRYAVGETITIAAVANEGFHFVVWNDDNTDATRQIVADTLDLTFTATFAANPVADSANITVVSADETMGTVTGSGRYEVGETITITAVAITGYHFVAWNDGNTEATRQIVVSADATYTATFAADENGIDDVMGNITIATRNHEIVIMGAENQSLVIYDVQGRIVVRENSMTATTYPMTATGVYMVQVGNYPAQKVVVVK